MTSSRYGRCASGAGLTLLLLFAATGSLAVGTAAGTDITNTASVSADIGGSPVTASSPPDVVTVAEIVDVDVTLLTAGNVLVTSPASSQVLSYRVTNIGNGIDDYLLVVNNTLGGDQFDPTLSDIYLDDGDGILNTALDTLYVPGGNDPVLDANNPAGDSIVIFVRNDIPAAQANGDLGDSQLAATSNTVPGAPVAPGTTIALAGDGGAIDLVVGTSGAQDLDTGTYQVGAIALSILKSSAVSDPFGGSEPIPGATISYTLTVSTTGSGTANSVVVTDAIPGNTTYVSNSMTLNAVAQTDASDSPIDDSDYNVTNATAITVDLGNVVAGSPADVITFDVTIN